MYELTPDLQPALLSSFSGDRRFSRFGGALHLSDLDGDGIGRRGPVRLCPGCRPLVALGPGGRVPWDPHQGYTRQLPFTRQSHASCHLPIRREARALTVRAEAP